MKYENPVLSSTAYVVEHATEVSINKVAIRNYAESFKIHPHTNWMRESFDLSGLSEEELAMLCLVFNSISFSYWGDPYWSVEYKGKSYDRASWSMVASILRSKEEGNSLLDPHILIKLTKESLSVILRGTTEIPMLQERTDILVLVGTKILEHGFCMEIIKEAEHDALRLVQLILTEFAPVFDDYYEYKGEVVYFNKRAQALTESLHSMFSGEEAGSFSNMNQLSALADYIIPNLLRKLGILEYSDELKKLIDSKAVLEKGSVNEIEIRASTVWAIEWIRLAIQEVQKQDVPIDTINDDLWIKGGEVETPFHLVRTTAY